MGKRGTPLSSVNHHDEVENVIGTQYVHDLGIVEDPVASFQQYEDMIVAALDDAIEEQTTGHKIALLKREGYSVVEISLMLKITKYQAARDFKQWVQDHS